ncbi:MAG: GNAT family N-acetyltransferase [Actinobacteria bacterium]|nr:GNAT family N-acetyltransferase [Actinomycetota bacterium]
MQIRAARPEEAQKILDFIMELAIYEKCPEEAVATLEDIANTFFTENPQVFCNFVEVGNQIVGFVVWYLNYSTWTGTHGIYVEDLFVLPEHRGNGYGKALLTYLANVCVTRGYERLQWWVLNWNQPSIEFYESLGAKPMNEWTVMRVDEGALAHLASLDS